jgi:glucan-binding YG repeat protein
LEGSDSGSLVFFNDKNNKKQVFAYGVCEVDELLLQEQHKSASSCSFDDDESESEWQDKDKLECEKEWVVFQEESKSDISEKEMERKEERNSKEKVKASGPYFICLRLDTALENLGFEKAACFQNSGCN